MGVICEKHLYKDSTQTLQDRQTKVLFVLLFILLYFMMPYTIKC